MGERIVASRDLRQGKAPQGIDLDKRRRTFEWFARATFLFAAHVLVILGLLALFRG